MLLSDNLNKYFDPSKKLDIDFDYFSSKVIGTFYMFDKNNVEIKKYVYNEIVKEWINIDWKFIENLSTETKFFPFSYSEIVFKHVFPSVMKYIETSGGTFLTDGFISNDLNMYNDSRGWRYEFYLSFPDDLSKLIALILKKDNDLEAKEALDSYWGYFLK